MADIHGTHDGRFDALTSLLSDQLDNGHDVGLSVAAVQQRVPAQAGAMAKGATSFT